MPVKRFTEQVTVYPRVIKIDPQYEYKASPALSGGIRGAIVGFTAESRRRMLSLVRRIDLTDKPYCLFSSMTYHDNWKGRDYKRDLDNYIKRLRRRTDFEFIWRIDDQKRGAPHYHFLFLPGSNALPVEQFEAIVADQWHDLVDPGNRHHKRHGVETIPFIGENRFEGIAQYVGKYSANVSREGITSSIVGRHWGHSPALPLHEGELKVVPEKDAQKIRQWLIRALWAQGSSSKKYAEIVEDGFGCEIYLPIKVIKQFEAYLKFIALPPPPKLTGGFAPAFDKTLVRRQQSKQLPRNTVETRYTVVSAGVNTS